MASAIRASGPPSHCNSSVGSHEGKRLACDDLPRRELRWGLAPGEASGETKERRSAGAARLAHALLEGRDMRNAMLVLGTTTLALVSACGEDDGQDPATEASLRAHVLEGYASREEVDAHCESLGDPGWEEPELDAEQRLLLDATPACDLTRLNATAVDDGSGRHLVDASTFADELSYALCSCTQLEASNRVMAPGESRIASDLGANERLFGSAPVRIDGMAIAGQSARFDNAFEAQELRVEETLDAANEITIAEDAVLGGLEIPGERVNVGGTLTVPEGADLSSVESSNDVVYDDVDLPEPCDCSEDIDYADLRDQFLDPDGDGEDDYDDPGLHAERDVDVAGEFRVDIDDSASLHLYVAGTFNPTNRVTLGNASAPAAMRMYVRDELRFAGPVVLSGTVYAPTAPLTVNNTLECRGALFAEALDFAGPIQVEEGPRFTRDGCLIEDKAGAELEAGGDD